MELDANARKHSVGNSWKWNSLCTDLMKGIFSILKSIDLTCTAWTVRPKCTLLCRNEREIYKGKEAGNHNCIYLLTPWSRVLLEKLTGSAASQEIPRIFGTRRFITVFTSVRHLSLSWANSIQSSQPPSTSWRSILILSFHLRLGLPSGLLPSGFPNNCI